MAANQSNLANPQYGFDLVVATTEASINATMKKYLSNLRGATTYLCYVKPSRNSPLLLIPFDELLQKTKGYDPFKIKNNEVVENNQDMQNISDAGFVAGIKMTIGLPNNYDVNALATLPKIIELQSNATVKYRMFCSDIQIVEQDYDKYGPLPFFRLAQSDKPNQAWNLVSDVDLRLSKDAPFDKLPDTVKEQIKNTSSSMFSVQQLLFDLNNAGLSTVPKVEGLDKDSNAQVLLSKYFVNTYFDAVQKAGQPVLNHVVVPRKQHQSTLKPTDLNFHIGPLIKEKDPGLKTLDYLCAVNNNTLPSPRNFAWDWVTADDSKQAHGVIAISRNAFANYIRDLLVKDAKAICFVPHVRCWVDGLELWWSTEIKYNPETISSEIPPSGETIVTVNYDAKSEDEAGANGALGSITTECKYWAKVVARGNKLEVESGYRAHLYIRNAQTRADGDPVHKIYNETLELAVDAAGKMVVKKDSKVENKHYENKASGFTNFFAEANSTFDKFKGLDYEGCTFEGLKIGELQDFIFPGGETFAFKGFHFSDNQDLICSITYADPS